MTTYLIFINLTEKGIQEIKESPARLDQAKQAAQSMGGEIKQFYLTMGMYDMICVVESPDDETVAKLALTIGSAGAIRTTTLKAFSEDDYRKIIASLP